MNKGKTLIVGTPDDLQNKANGQSTLRIELKVLEQKIISAARRNSYAKTVNEYKADNSLQIAVDDVTAATPEIVRDLVQAGADVLSVNLLRPTLEEAYLRLIQRNS
jgi:ABC-type multidrug transport system ATPase subunit